MHQPLFHPDNLGAERNTRRVIVLTLVMMVIEIFAGWRFGSMALLADGWHMGTHFFALGITALAYAYSRRHRSDRSYSYGTGKVGVLSGYTSALLLAAVALLMIIESGQRLIAPLAIHFNEALLVAILGLIVNLASAVMLGHGQGDHAGHRHDHNLKAAYLHVVADALTSVLAILALVVGKYFAVLWLDALIGMVGALVIAVWAWGLLRDTSDILLDRHRDLRLETRIRETIEAIADTRIIDLHVRKISSATVAVEMAIRAAAPRAPNDYKKRLEALKEIVHLTIEIHPASGEEANLDTPFYSADVG